MLAHLYRAEVYRSTVWRSRLDTTTNWSVVTLGVALSLTYAAPDSSALPLLLVGFLILFFWVTEARRYRYFTLWRARARIIETRFVLPMLRDGGVAGEGDWRGRLAESYADPEYRVPMVTALARRLRTNYLWILLVQTLAYLGKLVVHPTPAGSFGEFAGRASIGALPGLVVLGMGALYVAAWASLAIWIIWADWRDGVAEDDLPRG